MQSHYWGLSLAWVVLGAFAAWRDRRRNHRTDLDRVGWVPWPLVLILAILGAATCAAIALKS